MIEQQGPTGSRRRVLLIGSGLGGVLLGVLLLATVFGGGGDGDAVGAPPRPTLVAVPEPSVAEASLPRGASAPVLAAGADPFSQIVTVPEAPLSAAAPPPAVVPPAAAPPPLGEPPAAVPPASGPPGSGPPAVPPPTVSLQDAGGSTEPTVPPGDAAASPAERPADGNEVYVELRSTFRDSAGVDRAHITVDDQSHTPAVGEQFSFGFRLERIDGTCIEMSTPYERVELCRAAPTP